MSNLTGFFIIVCQIAAKADYPYSAVSITYGSSCNADSPSTILLSSDYKEASEFFVAWGSLTLFYGVIAILVYMFATANSKWEWFINYLIIAVSYFIVLSCICFCVWGILSCRIFAKKSKLHYNL